MFIDDKVLSYYLSDKKGVYFFPDEFACQMKSGVFENEYYRKK